MATVFRARDERLGRLVALKILASTLAADSAFRRRFIAESRAAAAVDDPHIIPVYEAGAAGGVLFIAMRFVGGGDLRRVLEHEGPLPPGRAAEFISPVASALDAAHGAGLVHRDVKPANILVDARPGRPDHVYLSDFGVSRGATSSASLTGTGQFLGTPDHSAPEQIEGRAMDGRADQYALACVAYQLLTGVVPFRRDQGMAVSRAGPGSSSARSPSCGWPAPWPKVTTCLGSGAAGQAGLPPAGSAGISPAWPLWPVRRRTRETSRTGQHFSGRCDHAGLVHHPPRPGPPKVARHRLGHVRGRLGSGQYPLWARADSPCAGRAGPDRRGRHNRCAGGPGKRPILVSPARYPWARPGLAS